MDEKERTAQEMEFILDGITTRMQMAMGSITESSKNAMEKMAESNRLLRSSNRLLCIVLLTVVIIVVAGFVGITQIWIGHVNQIQNRQSVSEVMPGEAVSEFRPAADD